MINYRVENLNELIIKLKNNHVNIIDTIEVYEYGKFTINEDPEVAAMSTKALKVKS